MASEDYLASLNKEQLEAVKTVYGPVMVFAGAGTGKTKTLITRIIYMIKEENIKPYNILAITFTKKATNEMKERLEKVLGMDARAVHISTIHSLCAMILRHNSLLLGYERNFEVIDEEDQLKALNEIYKKEDINKNTIPPRVAIKAIGDYKNKSCSELLGLLNKVYELYQTYLKEHNLMDFDDLLVLTEKLFKEQPNVLSFYQEAFKYILVDELQDTNAIQYEIINLLCQKHHNIFAVGDDDQSIYSFRGAKIENMLNFKEDYPDAKIIKLVENYRSTNIILKGANALIRNNKIREAKELFSEKEGSKNDVIVQEAYYYADEIRYVVNEIATLVRHENYQYKDIAVIYRNSALSHNFELAFIQDKIPYNIYGSYAYLKRKEVKDIISYLRFIAAPSKIIHFKRIINVPSRGVGEKTIDKLEEYMKEYNCDILSAIDLFKQNNTTSKSEALTTFKEMIEDLCQALNEKTLPDFFDYMLEKTGYENMLRQDIEDANNRLDNVEEFRSILVQIENEVFEEEVTQAEKLEIGLDELLLDTTTIDDHVEDGVILSTVHSVKGLEFKAVFVVGLEEGIFPSIREEVDMEEERRVAYVAFTRAKERLYLTCATRRLIYGRFVHNQKSRFLMEYLNAKEVKEAVEEKKVTKAEQGEITVGSRINHKFFGNGIVIAKDDAYVQILFDKDKSIKKISKDHPTLVKIA